MAAAAAAAAAALGLGDEVDEENEEALAAGGDPDDPAGWEEVSELKEDDPSLDEEAIEELKAEERHGGGLEEGADAPIERASERAAAVEHMVTARSWKESPLSY
jgi:hypothetical protein